MANIKIMALGGLGENGKNMYIVEVDTKIFILDAGMKYPDIDMYGVDGVIPNINYLIDHKENIEGIFISHGHEDHIGAIPYLLEKLSTRVYGTHFTISLIESILIENNMNVENYKLFRINSTKIMKFGHVDVTFFNTTHSIPESLGICISTRDGSIVYCTDFNFNAIRNATYQTTYDKIIEITKYRRVLALLTESVNAGSIGRITNDSLLEHNFHNILMLYRKRIIIGAYSTDLIRIQKVIDMAKDENRKIAIISSKNERIIKVAMDSTYLNIPEELYVDINKLTAEEIANLEDTIIIVTGYRNEPYTTLVKMAIGEHSLIKLTAEDKVITMCPPVPGTEKHTTNSINTLYEYDVNLSIFDKDVLRSAHASPEDLKTLYAMLKPKYIVPIKGEYRHMYEQNLVAQEYGYDKDHIMLLDNGQVLEFNDGELASTDKCIEVGDIYIDGTSVGVVDETVIQERTQLAEEGIIFVYCSVDLKKKCLSSPINISTKGISYGFSAEELTNSLSGIIESMILNAIRRNDWNLKEFETKLAIEVAKQILRFTKHRPLVIPVILEN